jgi:hypothetical protein
MSINSLTPTGNFSDVFFILDKNNERPDNIIMKKLVERANLGHGSL